MIRYKAKFFVSEFVISGVDCMLNAAMPVDAVRQRLSFSCDSMACIRYDFPVPAVP